LYWYNFQGRQPLSFSTIFHFTFLVPFPRTRLFHVSLLVPSYTICHDPAELFPCPFILKIPEACPPESKYNRFSKNSTKTSGIGGGFLSTGTSVQRAVSQAVSPLLMFRNAAETSVAGSQKIVYNTHLLPQGKSVNK